MSSESKKGVHQIGQNSFLFYNTPEIFYSISFEIDEPKKIRIILLKMVEIDTYIFSANVPFSNLGTGDSTPQETIKNVNFLIFNYNFFIKEGLDKSIYLLIQKIRQI